MNNIDKAYEFAKQKHAEQKYSGRPFIYHPLQTFRVLEILVPDDENLLMAALLHDTLEDTKTTYDELKTMFNEDIANLVQEVTKSEYNTFPHLKTQRGVLLKFADRTSNLSNITSWDKPKQLKYIRKSRFWKTK